ncbi:Thiamine transporter 2 [Amphibalanus amphitrite]|uniref:Thiamine transporter 2 n=1 Tax=Amphibalanus amphitrite TaxID=1232801 RepID=A0A6A4VVP1_AMPAM|nr:Thiamine transporter 2 [Amphibalanus amphitrite]
MMASCSEIYNRWWVVTLMLCSYGFFKEMRPSEPYLTESLTKYNNVTKQEVSEQIYPVWTYAYLGLLVFVFLLTDMVRYKPMIIFEALGYIATWTLLIWGRGVVQMQLMEFMYGIATSTEVAYLTYIYARVDSSLYQRVTGYVRAALLLGRFASGVLSQSLVSSEALNFFQLNYISFCSVSVAFCIAVCLPTVKHSIYFHRQAAGNWKPDTSVEDASNAPEGGADKQPPQSAETEGSTEQLTDPGRRSCCQWLQDAGGYMLADFRSAYSSPSVVQWSLWWAFATCGNFQVGNYGQPLWEEIAPWEDFDSEGALYNGLVEASNTLLGALAVSTIGHLRLNWEFLGEPVLAVFSCIAGSLLLTMALTSYIGVAYVTYVFFRIIYQMLITICSFQVAKAIPKDSYGLVFGINTFMALALQTILTTVVASKAGFALTPRPQVYGGYFLDLGVLFVLLMAISIRQLGWTAWKSQPVWLPREPASTQLAEE